MVLNGKKIFFGVVIIILCLVYGYLFFERYLTEEEIKITVINSEKFGNEPNEYLIFTKDEVFEDVNNSYHQKYNADEIYSRLIKGRTYKVKVVGVYLPGIPRFRNIVEIVDDNLPAQNIIP